MKHISHQLLLSVVVVVLISGCATKGSRWKDASSINTIAAYREFLRRYPKGALADEARSRIEKLYFDQARAKHKVWAYEHFLRRYPKGALADEARLRVKQLNLKYARDTDDIGVWQDFLRRYPKGALADEARSRIKSLELQKAKDTNTIRGYETFLRRYPKGALADEARASLQSLKEQIEQVREAAKSAFRDPKQAKVEVRSLRSKPCFVIEAVLLQRNSANEDSFYRRYYDSHKGLTVLVKKRCARILKSIAKGSKLPDTSEIAIWGRLSGGKEGFGPMIYEISITIDEIKKHDWSSIEEKKIMELWKVEKNYIHSLQFKFIPRPPTLPELRKMLKN